MTYEKAEILCRAIIDGQPQIKNGFENMMADFYETVLELIEKQMPKRAIEERYFGEMGCKIGYCPNCHTGQSCDDNSIQHCYYCGQAIDWSEE